MHSSEHYAYFHQQRWPNGFECPRCAHTSCYTIITRRLPLYQCRLCKHQTTLTAGTVMDRSRTPLEKWAAAIELLTSTGGVNAVQLSAGIGVSHKTAWLMLRKFRRAIGELEAGRKLQGTVHAGLRALSPYFFHSHALYAKERVILIGGSLDDKTGEPTTLKMTPVSPEHLDGKRFNREGAAHYFRNPAQPLVKDAVLLPSFKMASSPLRRQFDAAAKWMNRLYRGLGSTYLQSYLDEYCFRWNAQRDARSLRDAWYQVCFCVTSRADVPAR
jgi:transposase-like protein